jgi:hypothetical protein
MAIPSAATIALNTPELLQSILIHLPPKHILSANRINKTFRITISSSPRLQRRLFFRPTLPSNGETISSKDESTSLQMNPLLVSAFPELFNPSLDPSLSEPQQNNVQMWHSRPAAFAYKEASWRHMLITTRPIYNLKFKKTIVGFFEFESSCSVQFSSENGIKMGMLYDFMYDYALKDGWPYVKASIVREDVRTGGSDVESMARVREKRGLVLLVEVNQWTGGCCDDSEDEDVNAKTYFKSEAYAETKVEFMVHRDMHRDSAPFYESINR